MGLAYRCFLRPLLFRLNAETAHHLTLGALRYGLGNRLGRGLARLCCGVGNQPRLKQTLWGLDFPHPVGLAAGLDKDARVLEPLAALGFGHVEVGTLTGQAQPGNDRPRLFRLVQDQAIVNRMGFNNGGAENAALRLAHAYDPRGGRRRPPCVLGINIGRSKAVANEQALADYRTSVHCLAPLADYLVVNVSSPNTPGLRDLQSASVLRPLLQGVKTDMAAVAPATPLLLKIAPDLHDADIDAAVDAALEAGCAGLIATNTTISRENLVTPAERVASLGNGGLSGRPLRSRATMVLARVARRVAGRCPVIGVGGVDSWESAWEKIVHGASLVQIYSGLVYQGPGLVRAICRGLDAELERLKLQGIGQAVGRQL